MCGVSEGGIGDKVVLVLPIVFGVIYPKPLTHLANAPFPPWVSPRHGHAIRGVDTGVLHSQCSQLVKVSEHAPVGGIQALLDVGAPLKAAGADSASDKFEDRCGEVILVIS